MSRGFVQQGFVVAFHMQSGRLEELSHATHRVGPTGGAALHAFGILPQHGAEFFEIDVPVFHGAQLGRCPGERALGLEEFAGFVGMTQ